MLRDLLILVLALCLTGCLSQPDDSLYLDARETLHVTEAALAFRRANARWPETWEELADGAAEANVHLPGRVTSRLRLHPQPDDSLTLRLGDVVWRIDTARELRLLHPDELR